MILTQQELAKVETMYREALLIRGGAEFSGHPQQLACAAELYKLWPKISEALVQREERAA